MAPSPQYTRPRSLPEAAEIMRNCAGGGVIVAGGTIIASLINQHLAEPSVLVDISAIDTMRGIARLSDGSIRLGALVSHEEVRRSDDIARHLPLMAEIAEDVSCWRLRNRGTLGGSICTVGGQGDPATGLIALGAQLVLNRGASQRTIPIEDFYRDGFSVDLEDDEILETVIVPPQAAGTCWAFRKDGPRNAMDWTQITVSVVVRIKNDAVEYLRIGVNGVAATALRAVQTESALKGQQVGNIDWLKINDALGSEISPESDLVYSADFKRHLGSVLLRRAFNAAVAKQESVV